MTVELHSMDSHTTIQARDLQLANLWDCLEQTDSRSQVRLFEARRRVSP